MSAVLTPEQKEDICIVGGSVHPELIRGIAHSMGMAPRDVGLKTFPNGEHYCRYDRSVRGDHVFVIQPHFGLADDFTINDALLEQALLVEAASYSSAGQVTAVIPYLGYSRQDRKARGREPISVKLTLGLMSMMGADRIVAVDMHSPQTQLGFKGQFDHLTAQPLLLEAVRNELSGYSQDQCLVVSPDAGATKMSQNHAEDLDVDMVLMAKHRNRSQPSKIAREDRVSDVDGRVCVIFDDMIDTAGTINTAAEVLKKSGALKVIVAASHGIFSDPALERLRDGAIDRVLVSDTVPMQTAQEALGSRLKVVSIAPIIGQALIEIATNGSVSRLFEDRNHM